MMVGFLDGWVVFLKIEDTVVDKEDIAREAATRQNELADIMLELGKFRESIYSQHLSFDLRPETANTARNDVEDLKASLDAWRDKIKNRLEAVDALCFESADSLSPDQYAVLREKRSQLTADYDDVVRTVENIHGRLNVLASLLIEFSSKTSSLQSWMTHQTRAAGSIRERSADPQYFAEARREAKALLEEVAREESSLKAIGALLAKIEQEVDSLYDSVPDTAARGIHSTEIRNTFYRVEDDFSTLQKQCGDLIQFQNRIGSLGTDLSEHLRKVDDWFANMESKVTEVDRAPDMDVERKLVVLEDLNQQVVDGHKQFDQVDQASRRLLSALDGMNAHPDVANRHEVEASERKKRHNNLLDRIQEAFNHATAQKAANEGVRDAVLDLYPWLDDYEIRAKTSRDVPLVEEPLNELKREVQLLRMELDSRLALTKDLENDLRKLSASSPPRWKEDVEEKLKRAVVRLQKNSTELRGFRDNVNDALEGVVKLESTGSSLSRTCDAISSSLKATNARDLPRLQEAEGEIDSMYAQLADMRRTAEQIKKIPNATGAEAVDAYVNAIDNKVSGLNDELQAKHSQQAQVGHLENEFEDVKKRLNDWLGYFEADIANLEPVSVNREKLIEQRKQLFPLSARHKEGLALVEELDAAASKLGDAEETAALGNRLSSAPGNRLSAAPRVAMDLLTRYNAQADALKARAEKIDRAEHKAVDLVAAEEELRLWIAVQNKNLTDFGVPTTAEAVQSLQTSLDRLNKGRRAEQRRLDDIRIRGRELAGEASLPGEAQQVLDRSRVLSDEWDQLSDNVDAMRERLGKLEKWVDGYAATEKWLGAKWRMLSAVGVPTTDAAIASTQLGQIQIIKAEMDGERTSLSKLNNVAQKLSSELADNTLTSAMDDLNSSWNKLEEAIDEREQNIQRASKLGAEIKAVQKDIMNDLADVESDIDKFGNMLPSEVEAKLNELATIKAQLSGLNNKIDDMEELINSSEEVKVDPMNKGDLVDQMKAVKKKMGEMNRRLDYLKNMALSSRNEGDEIDRKLDSLLDLTQAAKSEIDQAAPISADSNRLQEQASATDALLTKIIEVESDFPYVRAMVTERLKKTPDDDLRAKLQRLTSSWNPVVAGVKERSETIAKVQELIRQFSDLEESVRENLKKDEEKFATAMGKGDSACIQGMLKSMDTTGGKRMADAVTLAALASRISAAAPGPDANKFHRSAENFTDDFNNLTKRINAAIETAQRKVDLGEKFNRLVDESRHVASEQRRALESGSAELNTPEKVAARIAEVNGFWNRTQRELMVCNNELKKSVTPEKAAANDETMTQLNDEFTTIGNRLRELSAALGAKKEDMEKLSEKSNQIKNDANTLFMELSDMDPVARSSAGLLAQRDEAAALGQKLAAKEEELQDILAAWDNGLSKGTVSQSQWAANKAAANDIAKLIAKAKKKLGDRTKKVDQAKEELEAVQKNATDLVHELDTACQSETLAAAPKVSDPVAQSEQLKQLKDGLKNIGSRVDDFVSDCKLLIRTAGPETDTTELDTALQNVGDKWSAVSTALAAKEREVDAAVQQLGRYEDAYKGLLNWLEETEELMENQKPPDADAKVAKAQLHAYDVLLKHIEDKDTSVKGFSALIAKIIAMTTIDEEVKSLTSRDEEIKKRYNDLVDAAHDRQRRLMEAVDLAERLAEGIVPLEAWLLQAEKRLNALGKIPGNVEKMEEQLREQHDLDEEIYQRGEEVDRVLAIVPMLSAVVSVEDANSLEGQANQIASRYETLAHRVRLTKDLLNEMALTVNDLFADVDNLEMWLTDMEQKVVSISEVAIAPDDLAEQSNIVEDLVTAVTERDQQITAVMEVGRQLCRQASGDEALALQYRMDQLKKRYGDIMLIADDKLALLAKAIPLSERFHEGFEAVMEWVEAVEEDLVQLDNTDLETQNQIVFSMEEAVSHWRPEVDDLIAVSSQLQAICSPEQADELFQSTAEMNRRVNQIAEKVARRAERLDVADRQSRAVFDDLNFLLEWLSDARDRVAAAGPPSIDAEFARTQLRNQLVMNDDVTMNKARLREVSMAVKKVCRELGGEGGESASSLTEQCDQAKDLVDEVSKLCADRTEILERALALSQHLAIEFDRLTTWLDQIDDELRTAPELTTATPLQELRKQREHNSELAAAILAYVPIVEQFRGDVSSLQEICVHEDGVKLGELADEIVAKYNDMRAAVEARGQALDSIVDATSGLGERLDNFAETLRGASDRLRQNNSISSDPTLLKNQIAENHAIKEGLRAKQSAYFALKESAAELLSSLPQDDPAREEISEKLRHLAELWNAIEHEAEDRGDFLESILEKARHFWNELDECQRAIDDLRVRLESVEPAAGQPEQLQQQQVEMQSVANNMATTENRLVELREAGAALSNIVPTEEQTVINAQVDAVQDGFATITKLFADKNRDLIAAMEDAMMFHSDLSNLHAWLDYAEERLAKFPATESLKVEEVPILLDDLHAFKDEMDKQAVSKEQLTYTAGQIASGAPAHQAAAIRQPINKLNLRWAQLYAALCDKENKVERMLLQMGRLSEAADQLIAWMRKTRGTLDELSLAAPTLRQLEIQRCQLTVVANDVHAHESSVATLNAAAQRLLRDEQNADALEKMSQMNKEWKELNDMLQGLIIQMEKAKTEAEKVGREAELWMVWLEDVESQLATTKPTGGLPETAESQLDDFRVLRSEIAQNKPAIEAYIDDANNNLCDGENNSQTWVGRNHALIRNKWAKVKELCADREKKLQLALEEAVALDTSMRDTAEWLTAAEQRLAAMEPVSRLMDVLETQVAENEKWTDEVAIRKQLMAEQQAAGTRLQYYCEKKDAIPIKNGLVSLKHRFEKVSSRTAERTKQLSAALDESRVWINGVTDILTWLEEIETRIPDAQVSTSNVDKLKQLLDGVKSVQADLTLRQPDFDITYKRGRSLVDRAPRHEIRKIQERNENLKKRWTTLQERTNQTRLAAEQALLDSSAFDEAILELESWIDDELNSNLTRESRVLGDVDTVKALLEEHTKREAERLSKKKGIDTVLSKASKLASTDGDENSHIKGMCSRVTEKWNLLEEQTRIRAAALDEAKTLAKDFDEKVHEILDWLVEIEGKLAVSTSDYALALSRVEDIKTELHSNRDRRDACLDAGRHIQSSCHPRAEQPMKHWIRVIDNRWREVEERACEREFSLLEQQQQEKEREEALFELLEFVAQKREELNKMLAKALPQDLDSMGRAQSEQERFDSELREKQSQVDSAIKQNKKGKRNAAATKLSDEWKHLWLDSMGHQTALENQREMLEEMRRLEGWRWENWKEQYVEWNDHRKARVSDLFRRIDRTHTGNVPRDVFIDGILASKFPTSRLEMNKVADLFDKGDGLINSKEFIDALRFDRTRELKPFTDHEKVNEEILKQKNACSCCQQFKIEKVAEGHYRFGDTQIKRMVRILRSTVMVRVGGGWEALDEFLSKHDPCRAKGRLNIDMFYKDVAPSTAVDTMRAFTKGRRARTNSSNVTSGPVMKIREKTERSIPMFPNRRDQSDNSADSPVTRTLLSSSRDSLATASSRPHSRASDSTTDERPSRIPSLRLQKGFRNNSKP